MAFDSSKTLSKPGELVPKAGIYKVLHQGHRAPHEVSLKVNDTFPACNHCGAKVRFELVVPTEVTDGGGKT
jgi:hypothetical protein